MIEKRLLLRVVIKLCIASSILGIAYIFVAGFFESSEYTDKPQYTFSVSNLKNNSPVYFKTDRRELLVIKSNDSYSVFWAHGPLYGCRLEFISSVIKPVCIDIEYGLNGISAKANQKLDSPEFNITADYELMVFP
jgi:hypothetical protein